MLRCPPGHCPSPGIIRKFVYLQCVAIGSLVDKPLWQESASHKDHASACIHCCCILLVSFCIKSPCLFLQGGSESWFTESNVAIASLAFHPTAQLLLIATNNELHFWDWSRPEPFAVVKTGSETERVRWETIEIDGWLDIYDILSLSLWFYVSP